MSKIFGFALKYLKDNIIISLAFLSILLGNLDDTVGRLFVDKARIVATGSLQSMEVGPVALKKYESLAAEFETDKIIENWNKRTNLDKSEIPQRRHVETWLRS